MVAYKRLSNKILIMYLHILNNIKEKREMETALVKKIRLWLTPSFLAVRGLIRHSRLRFRVQ